MRIIGATIIATTVLVLAPAVATSGEQHLFNPSASIDCRQIIDRTPTGRLCHARP